MSIKGYRKLQGVSGIYKHIATGNFMARKKIDGKVVQETFSSLFEAKKWRKRFNGVALEEGVSDYSTLKQVWETMQKVHFPTLATSTKAIWKRRYEPWQSIEHLPMDRLTPSRITSWVNNLVEHYKSDFIKAQAEEKLDVATSTMNLIFLSLFLIGTKKVNSLKKKPFYLLVLLKENTKN